MDDKDEKYIDTSDNYIVDHEVLIAEAKDLLAEIIRHKIIIERENINIDIDMNELSDKAAALRHKSHFCKNYTELEKVRSDLNKIRREAARLRTLVWIK